MENNAMEITRNVNQQTKQTESMTIKMKRGFSDKDLYLAIISQMEYSKAVNGNDIQQVLDWLKEKNFIQEHIYNPVV